MDRFKTFFAEEMNPPRRRFMSMRNFISRWLIRPHVLRFATRRNGPPKNVLAFGIGVIRKNVLDRLPGAIWPTITPTVTRMPRMHGLPPMTCGFCVMRLKSFIGCLCVRNYS